MKRQSPIARLIRGGLLLGAAWVLAACSLAEDITPPPGIELTQTAAAPAPVIPATRPDPIAGAEVFAQNCIKCHGPTGQGDGELAAQLTGDPPDFTDPATLRARAPHEIFTIVTQGRLEKTMPPFGNALTAEQRWDVVAFLYSLTEPLPETTETLFAAQCTECHVDGTAADLAALPFFATQTEQAIFDTLTTGLPDGSHTFTALSETERWELAQYVQALAYAPPLIAEPNLTPTPSAALTVTEGVQVSGVVNNGTANAVVPDGLTVELFVFDSVRLAGTYTTTVHQGRYEVAGLTLPAEGQTALAASIDYLGITYVSDILRVTEPEAQLDLPITLYETTTDPAAVRITRWHVVLSAPESNTIQVAELLIFANTGDRTVVASSAGQPTLNIPLPDDASNLQFEQSPDLYQPTTAGFGYVGPVLPGPEAVQMIFAFDVPLSRQAEFAQTTQYPVDGLNLLAPQSGLRVNARALGNPQVTDVQGTPYLSYNSAGLAAGEALTLTLMPGNASAEWTGWIVGGVSLLAVAGLGGWWWWQRRRGPSGPSARLDPAQRRLKLVDALARLDDDFANGQVADADYQRRRAKLKAEALSLMTARDE